MKHKDKHELANGGDWIVLSGMKEEGSPQIRDRTEMKTEEKDKLSYALIGYAMAAHREIGPGLDESLYHQFMYERARADGLELLTKPRGQLVHRQKAVDLFECDLLVPQRLICELKVLRGAFAAEHYAQILCYLKFWGVREIGRAHV